MSRNIQMEDKSWTLDETLKGKHEHEHGKEHWKEHEQEHEKEQ